MSEYDNAASKSFAWAIDFVRAYRSRPLWARVLARLAMGKHAYRELAGLADVIDTTGWDSKFPYDLQNMEYHKESVGQL